MTLSPLRVAILDDEAGMRVALGRLLHVRGYAIEEFETGEMLLESDVLAACKAVILDLHMPGMNGFQVLERLRLLPNAPSVIVITGHDQVGNEGLVKSLGASAYLTKPVNCEDLMEALALV